MIRKITSEEFEERERKKINRRYKTYLSLSLLGAFLFAGGAFYLSTEMKEKYEKSLQESKTPTIKSYLAIGSTLKTLRGNINDIKTRTELPYQTEEIKNNLEILYGPELKRVSILEKTISKVEQDSIKLSQHEEVKKYQKIKNLNITSYCNRYLVFSLGLLIAVGGSLFSWINLDDKKDKEMLKLEKKYSSKKK